MSDALIGQALHGYEDGHVLLSSSVKLDAQSAELMLLMSDLAPTSEPSSGGWLTAYPLPSNGGYVLARTWPAPEMRRPGCVWTHSLILENATIGARQSFHELLKLFRRPTGNFLDYAVQLEVPMDGGSRKLRPHSYTAAREALTALYGSSGAVEIFAQSEGQGEELALAIWEQQWPRLRRRLRWVSTQVGKSSDLPVFDFTVSVANELDPVIGARLRQGWVVGTLADLRSGGGPLRRKLRDFAIDVSSGRQAFSLLASAILMSDRKRPNATEVRQLLTLFETRMPKEGALAKSELIRTYLRNANEYDPAIIRMAIGSAANLGAESDEAKALAGACWGSDRDVFWSTIAADFPSAANGVISSVAASEALHELVGRPVHSSRILKLRPELSTQAEVWGVSPELRHEALDIARRDKKRRKAALTAAFRGQDLSAALHLTADVGAGSLLDTLTAAHKSASYKNSLTEFERAWVGAAAYDLEGVASTLKRGDASKQIVSELARRLGPTSFDPRSGSDIWFESWASASGSISRQDSEFLAAFFLMRSCRYNSMQRADMFGYAAAATLAGVEDGLMDYDASRTVSELSVGNIFNPFENRYRGLVRGLATWASRQSVPIHVFLAHGKNRHVEDFLDDLRWVPNSRQMARDALKRGKPLPKRRRQMLERLT